MIFRSVRFQIHYFHAFYWFWSNFTLNLAAFCFYFSAGFNVFESIFIPLFAKNLIFLTLVHCCLIIVQYLSRLFPIIDIFRPIFLPRSSVVCQVLAIMFFFKHKRSVITVTHSFPWKTNFGWWCFTQQKLRKSLTCFKQIKETEAICKRILIPKIKSTYFRNHICSKDQPKRSKLFENWTGVQI